MEKILKAHLEDLARRSIKSMMVTSSSFLSSIEADTLFLGKKEGSILGCRCILFGGYEEAERRIAFFLPTESDVLIEEISVESNALSLIEYAYLSEKFVSVPTHRDVLGTLMSKGIERDTIGDILLDEHCAYVFVCKAGIESALSIDSIARQRVTAKIVPFSSCPTLLNKEAFTITVASIRLDLIVAESFHLSREKAKQFILAKKVHTSFHSNPQNDYSPKPLEKIYLEGSGKIVFLGEKGTSKKGKIILEMERYI